MQIDILRPEELTARQIERWSALQDPARNLESPFLSPHWARAVGRAQSQGGRGDKSSIKVAMAHEGGEALAFMAARAGSFTAMPVGAPMSDYQGLVSAPGVRIDPVRLVQALGVGRLDFCHMLADQPEFAGHVKGVQPSFVIEVPDGYEPYAKARREAGVGIIKDVDKKRRKAERDFAEPVFTAFSRSRSDFDQLIAWKREQWLRTGQTDVLAAGWPQRLVRDLFQSRDPDFGGALFTLHIGDRLAAAQFNLRQGATLHSWLIAHDPRFERVSPGLLLFQDILKWMDGTPYWRLDLGAGDYRFKREFSNAQLSVAHGFVGAPSLAALLREAAYSLRQAAESLPLGPVSDLPAKAMRRMDLIRGLG